MFKPSLVTTWRQSFDIVLGRDIFGRPRQVVVAQRSSCFFGPTKDTGTGRNGVAAGVGTLIGPFPTRHHRPGLIGQFVPLHKGRGHAQVATPPTAGTTPTAPTARHFTLYVVVDRHVDVVLAGDVGPGLARKLHVQIQPKKPRQRLRFGAPLVFAHGVLHPVVDFQTQFPHVAVVLPGQRFVFPATTEQRRATTGPVLQHGLKFLRRDFSFTAVDGPTFGKGTQHRVGAAIVLLAIDHHGMVAGPDGPDWDGTTHRRRPFVVVAAGVQGFVPRQVGAQGHGDVQVGRGPAINVVLAPNANFNALWLVCWFVGWFVGSKREREDV